MPPALAKRFHRMKGEFLTLLDAVDSLGAAVRTSGPIDKKTANLVQLVAAATNPFSEGAMHSHEKRARRERDESTRFATQSFC